jgi:hypothetical protein
VSLLLGTSLGTSLGTLLGTLLGVELTVATVGVVVVPTAGRRVVGFLDGMPRLGAALGQSLLLDELVVGQWLASIISVQSTSLVGGGALEYTGSRAEGMALGPVLGLLLGVSDGMVLGAASVGNVDGCWVGMSLAAAATEGRTDGTALGGLDATAGVREMPFPCTVLFLVVLEKSKARATRVPLSRAGD